MRRRVRPRNIYKYKPGHVASFDCWQVTPSSAQLRTEPNREEWWLNRLFDHPGDRLCQGINDDPHAATMQYSSQHSLTAVHVSSTEDYLGILSSLYYYFSKLPLPSYQLQCSFPDSMTRIFPRFHIRVSVPPTYPRVFPSSSPNQISAIFKCSFITALRSSCNFSSGLDFKTIQLSHT